MNFRLPIIVSNYGWLWKTFRSWSWHVKPSKWWRYRDFFFTLNLKLHCPICPSIEVILDWVKTFCLNWINESFRQVLTFIHIFYILFLGRRHNVGIISEWFEKVWVDMTSFSVFGQNVSSCLTKIICFLN